MGTAAKTGGLSCGSVQAFWTTLTPGVAGRRFFHRGRKRCARLIEAGLAEPKGSELKFSDDGKLIALMLCDLFKHQKIKSDVDPNFVAAMIHRGALWALGWEYTGIFHGHEDSRATLKEVLEILDMWTF